MKHYRARSSPLQELWERACSRFLRRIVASKLAPTKNSDLPVRWFAPTLLLSLAFLLGGCASFETSVDRGRSLRDVQRFFVLSNPTDNRALDQQIARAFKARGRTVEIGPLTMMPDDTQAVVAYLDHWAWDFGEHLVYLQITVRDPLTPQPYASVTFSTRVSLREQTAVTVNRLVGTLLEK